MLLITIHNESTQDGKLLTATIFESSSSIKIRLHVISKASPVLSAAFAGQGER